MCRIISLHYANVPACACSNNKRIVGLDLARGFTVLFIPAVHSVMLYSNVAVHQSWLGRILAFVAEWPGAQVFMFVMGMNFSFSRKTVAQQIKRAAIVFAAGYVLNFFKFVVPYWFGWLPASLFNDLHFSHTSSTAVHLFLIGDILQFAGISLAVMIIIKRIPCYAIIGILLIYFTIVCSHIFWNLHSDQVIVDHFLHLIGGNIDDVFFPVMPWLIYPLAGLAIGQYLQGPFSIVPVFISGLFLFVGGYCIQFIPFHFPDSLFWRTYPDKTIMHLGFVMVWVSMWFYTSTRLSMTSAVLRVIVRILCFCSKNITAIYLVQWLIIFWMLPLFGYRRLDIGESIVVMGLVYVIVFSVVLLYRKWKPG